MYQRKTPCVSMLEISGWPAAEIGFLCQARGWEESPNSRAATALPHMEPGIQQGSESYTRLRCHVAGRLLMPKMPEMKIREPKWPSPRTPRGPQVLWKLYYANLGVGSKGALGAFASEMTNLPNAKRNASFTQVLCTGGCSSQLPCVRRELQESFGAKSQGIGQEVELLDPNTGQNYLQRRTSHTVSRKISLETVFRHNKPEKNTRSHAIPTNPCEDLGPPKTKTHSASPARPCKALAAAGFPLIKKSLCSIR